MTHLKSALAVLFAMAIFTLPCFGQATVNETLESITLYVDATNGSDNTPCTSVTQTSPLQTINAAANCAMNFNSAITTGSLAGTNVLVQPGTYRESILMTVPAMNAVLPITIQAVTPGTVTVSGAVQYTGWTPSGTSGVFQHNWPNAYGLCPKPTAGDAPPFPDIALRRETLFINGSQVTQVLSQADMTAGTFYVDETHQLIYLQPQAGVNLSTADVEVGNLAGLLTIGRSSIVIRNINFQYDNSCRDGNAILVNGATSDPAVNVWFDSISANWNNAIGLIFANPATNFTVSNSTFNHNGMSGMGSNLTKAGLWTNNTASYNNFRSSQGAVYNYNLGGFHPFQAHGQTITNLNVLYNQTFGAHWDTDHRQVVASGILAVNNLLVGDFYEKNEGPITITNSTYCGNNPTIHDQSPYGGGLEFRNSNMISVSGSYLYNNAVSQINIQGQAGGISVTDWETGTIYNTITENTTFANDVFYGVDATQNTFRDSYLGSTDWTLFASTLHSSANTWWNPATTLNFTVPPGVNSPLTVDLPTWVSITGQDTTSTFAQPPSPSVACAGSSSAKVLGRRSGKTGGHALIVTSDYPDFWLVAATGSVTETLTGTVQNQFAIQPVGVFNSTIAITTNASTIVPGLTYTIDNPTITGGLGLATVTYTIPASVPAGAYQILTTAVGGGQTHTTTTFLNVPAGSVRLSTVSLAFGNQVITTTSPIQTVTLTNVGSAALHNIVPTASVGYGVSSNCPSSLASLASCTLSVTFTPITTGSDPGTISIADSDVSTPQVITLSGSGLLQGTATLTPANLSYGGVALGQSSTLSTILTNTSNNGAPVTITAIGPLTGVNDFTESDNCPRSPLSLAVGATCTISVTFAPQATGSRTGSLVVTDVTVLGAQTLTFNGTGSAQTGTITLTPTVLNFPGTTIGNTSTALTTTVKNTSASTAVTISSVVAGGEFPSDYAVTNLCPASLAAQATCTLSVKFTPGAVGLRPGFVILTDSGSPSTQTLSVSGSGILGNATATLTPASLNLGTISLGSTSGAMTSTLKNTSASTTLTISSILPGGTDSADYKVSTTTCGTTLTAGATCTISVTFTPLASGVRPATVIVSDNTSTGATTLTLTGTGLAPTATLTPATLPFGNLTTGTTLTKTATLKNSSASAGLLITSIAPSGTNSGSYTSTDTCPRSPTPLAAGASCVITVVFKPLSNGALNSTVVVTNNTSTGATTLTVTGSGFPTASLTPATLAFGNVDDMGGAHSTLTSTLKNTSASDLLITSITPTTGTNAKYYSSTDLCPKSPATLAAGASCVITVTFTPTVVGSLPSSVTITDNEVLGSRLLSLTGSGILSLPKPKLTPATLSFGNVTEGTTSSAKTVTLTNTATDPLALLTIISKVKSGTNASEYTVTDNCPAILAAGANCTFTVTFSPVNTNVTTVTETVTDNASPSTQTFTMTGTGVAAVPTVTLTPTPLAFGAHTVGTATTMSAVLKNTSTNTKATLLISSYTFTGTASADYTQTNNCPVSPATLAAGGTCTITVKFTPSAKGSRNATLAVNSNVMGGKTNLSLTGSGS